MKSKHLFDFFLFVQFVPALLAEHQKFYLENLSDNFNRLAAQVTNFIHNLN
jgi:hypothetical protein